VPEVIKVTKSLRGLKEMLGKCQKVI